MGLPLMIIPLAGEDIFHAMRCADLGFGRVVKLPNLFENYMSVPSYSELSVDSVREGVQQLLMTGGYRQQSMSLGAEMRRLPGPDHAVGLIEALVEEEGA